jgi:hypothetical protein
MRPLVCISVMFGVEVRRWDEDALEDMEVKDSRKYGAGNVPHVPRLARDEILDPPSRMQGTRVQQSIIQKLWSCAFRILWRVGCNPWELRNVVGMRRGIERSGITRWYNDV